MGILFMLVLLGSLHAIRAQENPSKGIATNSAGERPLVLKLDPKAEVDDYERRLRAAIEARWHASLKHMKYDGSSTGKVILQFVLHENGVVTELKVSESTVREPFGLLCQGAVSRGAPYPKWSTEMRKHVGAGSRPIKFTFLYDDELLRKK